MNTDASFVLHRCGRQASRSPVMSRAQTPPAGMRPATRWHGAPLLYCDLDWQPPIAAGGTITTWADTSSLRLSGPSPRRASEARPSGAGSPRS